MTERKRTILTGFAVLAFQVSAGAQVVELNTLKQAQARLTHLQDSLCVARSSVEAGADSMSNVIDSLKATGAFSLQDCLLESMNYVRHLAEIDGVLSHITADSTALMEQLRTAYDWQISRLLALNVKSPDEGLLRQLEIYQEERRALGEDIVPSQMRYPERMAILVDDGPLEIRQKIEYLGGLAERYTANLRTIEGKLGKLEEEDRMVDVMWVVTQGKRGIVGMRGLGSQVRQASDSIEGAQLVLAAESGMAGESEHVVTRRMAVNSVPRWSSDLISRRRELKAKQQELLELTAVVEERVATFRSHLDELLAGVD